MSARIISVTLLVGLLSSCSSPPDVRQGQCAPCIVSPRTGPLLKEAQQMIADKNFEGATAKLNEAEAVKSNPDDEKVINQMRRAVAICSSSGNCPASPSQP
jgi:hypothetical protein